MAKNIEMNILTSSGVYEALYPKTLGDLISGKVSEAIQADSATNATNASYAENAGSAVNAEIANDLSNVLGIEKGGTGGSTNSEALYNLINGNTTRSADDINTYSDLTYLGGIYNNIGYKFPISNLMTYINNNIESGAIIEYGNYIGTGSKPLTINVQREDYTTLLLFGSDLNSGTGLNTNTGINVGMATSGFIAIDLQYSKQESEDKSGYFPLIAIQGGDGSQNWTVPPYYGLLKITYRYLNDRVILRNEMAVVWSSSDTDTKPKTLSSIFWYSGNRYTYLAIK